MDAQFGVGDALLASRTHDDTGHEEAVVVDSYSLITGPETRPMVCVEFPDGERAYLRTNGPDVIAAEKDGVEGAEGGGKGDGG